MIERDWNDWDGLDAEIDAEREAREDALDDAADAAYDHHQALQMEGIDPDAQPSWWDILEGI